jgi:hypothetical protein
MLVADILESVSVNEDMRYLSIVCSDFLRETQSPLLKSLPTHYNNIQRVKARKHKISEISEVYNKAFDSTWSNLRQRGIITYPLNPPIIENTELFYVLPINGYQFMYSKEVTDSTSNYKQTINVLVEQFNNNHEVSDIIADLLKYTYTTENLLEGIQNKSEIIFYGIPYYYVIRVAEYPNYKDLTNTINKYNIKRN